MVRTDWLPGDADAQILCFVSLEWLSLFPGTRLTGHSSLSIDSNSPLGFVRSPRSLLPLEWFSSPPRYWTQWLFQVSVGSNSLLDLVRI
ncbi:hypothetical protein Y1Q_0016197 [Alligator mississippiensis]|uniref:Uncharacterized protein n=1 Tax=Alligator mississippiensis TaxID=8496 RepID=A0A151P147_ALLMI|nr:hypothetical protein Y1Q_0016197 [Alligator mississippiensis]